VGWSDIPRARVDVELAKLGITAYELTLDARDVPELKPLFRQPMSQEQRLRIALEWFGNEGKPQPEERTAWAVTGRTRDWGRLPRLDGGEMSERKLLGEQAEAGADERDAAARPPVPSTAAEYTYGTLQKGVKAFNADATPGDVARSASLARPDARRVRLLQEQGLLRLNDAGKLVVDTRVARRGRQYVLRYLSDDGTRWLDPNRELPGR
jgi:hypothetical protein